MFRLLMLFCFVAVFTFSTAFAQDASPNPETIQATPEILSLFNESLQSLSLAEPSLQAAGLFQLLGFGMSFEDKAPALKIIESLLVLAPSIEPEELRNQLYEGVASAFCDLNEYAKAVGILNRISKPTDRFECQLNIAIKIVLINEQDETLKPFDVSELLRQAAAGAVETKNVDLEAAAHTYLGRELARQGKKEESAVALAEAIRIIQKIDEIEELRPIVMSILQTQVRYGQIADALATLQTISDPDSKQFSTYSLIQTFIQYEKYDEAEQLLKTLPASGIRNSIIQGLVMESIKTITNEKVGELSLLMDSEGLREQFLQRIIIALQKNNRDDVAGKVGNLLSEPSDAKLALLLGTIELLLDQKQFTKAMDRLDKEESIEDRIRQVFKRQILMMQYRETHDESVAQQIVDTYTGADKIAVTELNEAAKQAVKNPIPAERMEVFLETLQEQFQIMDIAGTKQTLNLISEQLDKETDPVRLIQYRLLLARLQTEMQEKNGAKESLEKLMQTLSTVKDLKILKNLVTEQPEHASAVTEEGRIKVALPGRELSIDESAIQDQLFQVYLMVASLFAQSDASMESKAAFAKAKELVKVEPVAERKAEKLLILAQFLAEEIPSTPIPKTF